ncbi:MAG TPA: type II toxin-antitoxin system Phd/YefM family antitoxin [Candidatus Gracilibacteria bacterium]
MTVYSTTQARQQFSDLINQVKYEKKMIAIGRNNKKEVLMVPYPDVDGTDIPISDMNANSSSFAFLLDEPDLYSFTDLKKRYV